MKFSEVHFSETLCRIRPLAIQQVFLSFFKATICYYKNVFLSFPLLTFQLIITQRWQYEQMSQNNLQVWLWSLECHAFPHKVLEMPAMQNVRQSNLDIVKPGKITETEPNPNRTCTNIFWHLSGRNQFLTAILANYFHWTFFWMLLRS